MFLKNFFIFLGETLQIVVLALLIVLPIRYFIFQPFIVKGASMEPNFHDGDYLIVDEITYRFREPQRGEVIVFKYPQDINQRFIKRIIALPNESIKIYQGRIVIKDIYGEEVFLDEFEYLSYFSFASSFGQEEEIFLQDDQYFVMGDNRDHSSDSRRWGPLDRNYIIGRALFRAWPVFSASFFQAPSYR
jgi:signal peptidase I